MKRGNVRKYKNGIIHKEVFPNHLIILTVALVNNWVSKVPKGTFGYSPGGLRKGNVIY